MLKSGSVGGAHHRLVWEKSSEELWLALGSELQSSKFEYGLISLEHLEWIGLRVAPNVRALAKILTLVSTSGRPDEVLLSHWAKRNLSGETSTFEDYARERIRQPDLNIPRLIKRWRTALDKFVVPCSRPTTVPNLVFAVALGVLSSRAQPVRETPRLATVGAIRQVVRQAIGEYPRLDSSCGKLTLAQPIHGKLKWWDRSSRATVISSPHGLRKQLLSEIVSIENAGKDAKWKVQCSERWSKLDVRRSQFQGAAEEFSGLVNRSGQALLGDADLTCFTRQALLPQSSVEISIATGLGRQAQSAWFTQSPYRLRSKHSLSRMCG